MKTMKNTIENNPTLRELSNMASGSSFTKDGFITYTTCEEREAAQTALDALQRRGLYIPAE